MERFNNINWSWHTIRCGPDRLAYYDTTFDDHESDIFYCHINEIDPVFAGVPLTDDEDDDDPIDPRTNVKIENLVIDHTMQQKNQYKPNIFQKFITKSAMNEYQHSACLRVLKAIKGNSSIDPTDLVTFRSTKLTRKKENKLFLEFLQNHITANYNEYFEFIRKFFEISRISYEKTVHLLLSKENSFYSLQTAVPVSGVNGQSITTTASNPKILYKTGYMPILEKPIKFSDISEISSEFIEIRNDVPTNNKMDNYLQEVVLSQNLEEFIDVIIPENTLVLLLEAYSNNKIANWEIPINIEKYDDHRSIIIFEEHLPARNFDINKFKEIYKNYHDYQVRSLAKNWYCLDDNTFRECQKEFDESDSRDVNFNNGYTLYEFNDYLNRFGKYHENIMEPGFSLVKWKLSGEKDFNVVTKTKLQYFQKETNTLLYNSIKLEMKSKFGAEVMTISELLAEWMKLFLQANSIVERIRISPATCDELGRTTLSLKAIEDEMLRLYNANIPTMLSSLHMKFNFLQNCAKGEYLLKYSSNHIGKILIYKKTDQSTLNVISTHDMYKDYKYSENLLKQQEFLPIDMDFIAPMHEFYQILPCCFPHWGEFQLRKNIVNDKATIIRMKTYKKNVILQKQEKLARERRRQSKAAKKKRKQKTRPKTADINYEEKNLIDLDALQATYPVFTSINDLAKTNTNYDISVDGNLKCVYDFNEYASHAGVLNQPLEELKELEKIKTLPSTDLQTNNTFEPKFYLQEEMKNRTLTEASKISSISNGDTKNILAKEQQPAVDIRKKKVKSTKARILNSLRTKNVFTGTQSRK